MKRIFKLFSSKKITRRVVIHFDNGDWITTTRDGMVYVPWLSSSVPMRCEADGTVTLRLVWDSVPCNGYGKQYGNATWEYVK